MDHCRVVSPEDPNNADIGTVQAAEICLVAGRHGGVYGVAEGGEWEVEEPGLESYWEEVS
jgi:hypothetical protein